MACLVFESFQILLVFESFQILMDTAVLDGFCRLGPIVLRY